MLFLTAILLAAAFSWCFADALRKKPAVFYLTGAVLTAAAILLGTVHLPLPAWVSTYILGLFTRGAFAAALWCVVAFTGAFPTGSAPMKRLMPCRGELSIFAAVITVSHTVVYGTTYIKRLLNGSPAETVFVLTCIISLALLLIMVPLTVISFKTIRRKMKGKTWKAIQRMAYAFYALIYLHVMVIFIPRAQMGREGALLNVIVYSAVFLGYGAMRLHKFLARKSPERKHVLTAVCTTAFLLLTGGTGYAARPATHAEQQPATESHDIAAATEPATTTTAAETTGTFPVSTADTSAAATLYTTVLETASETAAESVTETSVETASDAAATQAETVQTEAPAPAETPAPEPEVTPEPVLLYNDGTYAVTVFGYDAEDHFEVTIENDRITAINGWCDESDPWYFNEAMNTVNPAIIAANSPDVPDAVSGATISSNAIKQAVRMALEQARKQ